MDPYKSYMDVSVAWGTFQRHIEPYKGDMIGSIGSVMGFDVGSLPCRFCELCGTVVGVLMIRIIICCGLFWAPCTFLWQYRICGRFCKLGVL